MWNPLTLGLILIIQTILSRVFLGFNIKSFWFLYILILIFVGGILVLFIYVTSIFPNEKFSWDQEQYLIFIIISIITLIILILLNKFFILNLRIIELNLLTEFKSNYSIINTLKIFNSKNNWLLIFLVNYLFYCMIVVIKITNFYRGPLRKINYV